MSDQFDDATERFQDAVVEMFHENASACLSILTGTFVGLTVELVRRNDGDTNKQITIDGGDSRDVTIHAAKNKAEADK